MMQRILVVGFLVGVFPVLSAERERDAAKSYRPEKQPKVNEKYLENFRKSNKEIAELYDEVQKSIDELVAKMAELEEAEPRDKRKLEKKVASMRNAVARDRRKLDKVLKKKIEPIEKEYFAIKGKHDGSVAKAKEYEAKGDEGRAQKMHQEASKISGKMEGNKRSLDLLYYHVFFKGEEVLKEEE